MMPIIERNVPLGVNDAEPDQLGAHSAFSVLNLAFCCGSRVHARLADVEIPWRDNTPRPLPKSTREVDTMRLRDGQSPIMGMQ